MDILNFISWIASKRRIVKSLNNSDLIPVGVRNETRDDKYITVAITAGDFLSQIPIPEPTYKVYTALLNQSGGDDPSTRFGDGTIEKGISYYINDNPDNEDLTLVGAPNNNPGTYFVATQTVTGAYTPNVVLTYNAGAPVVTVLENTIGNIWFGYNGTGGYYGNLSSGFPLSKTYCSVNSKFSDDGGASAYDAFLFRQNDDVITLSLWSYGTPSDNLIASTIPLYIEIRVYN